MTTSHHYICAYCGLNIPNQKYESRKYCNNKCQALDKQFKLYESLISGSEITTQTRTLGNLLREFEGNKCSVCNIFEWNGLPLKMELDHINGKSDDNSYSNLRLLCPNCHAQTPTYKNRNMGNGRATRRKRYSEGKSY